MKKKKCLVAYSLAGLLLVSMMGCQGALTGSSYGRQDARKMQMVYSGTVISVNPATIEGEAGPIGVIAGGATGAGAIKVGLCGIGASFFECGRSSGMLRNSSITLRSSETGTVEVPPSGSGSA